MTQAHGIEKALAEAGKTPGEAMRAELDAAADAQDAFDFGPDMLEREAEQRKVTLAPPGRTGGRPKGVKNKATKDLMEALERYGHKDPLVSASEMITHGVHNIRAALGCEVDKAIDLWRWAHEFVAKYKHAPPPAQIDVSGAPDIPINIGIVMPNMPEALQNRGVSGGEISLVAQEDSRIDDVSS